MELDLAPQVQQALAKDWEPMYRSQLHYLVTWNTRARRPVLKERHVEALKALIRQACEEREIELVAENPKYSPIIVDPDSSFRVLGTVRGVVRTV